MKLGLEVVDFLELISTNHKLHLAVVRPHIWPFVQGDISLRSEPFSSFSRQKLALSDSSKLVPWNYYTPCFLTKSIGALGTVSRSKTLSIPKKFLTTIRLTHVHF